MGVGFITYAKMTPEFQTMSRPERATAMERLKGQASEQDVRMRARRVIMNGEIIGMAYFVMKNKEILVLPILFS
jgi:hypothetical protein